MKMGRNTGLDIPEGMGGHIMKSDGLVCYSIGDLITKKELKKEKKTALAYPISETDLEVLENVQDIRVAWDKKNGMSNWSAAMPRDYWLKILEVGMILGAYIDGQLVAYLPITELDPRLKSKSRMINAMKEQLKDKGLIPEEVADVRKPCVHPDYRGMGLGKALLVLAIQLIEKFYQNKLGIIMALPVEDFYSGPSFRTLGFLPTGVEVENINGEKRILWYADV